MKGGEKMKSQRIAAEQDVKNFLLKKSTIAMFFPDREIRGKGVFFLTIKELLRFEILFLESIIH